METPKKKKSAKKHKNKDKHSNVPSSFNRNGELLPSEHEIIPPPRPISPNQERPLSPDSALASSESSGSSLRKQGKVGNNSQNNNNNGLFRIVTYQQFKPVLRKSANIQEKIAIFSRTGQPSTSMRNSSTTGKTFPIQISKEKLINFCQTLDL